MVEGTTVVTRTDTLSDGTILGVGGSVDLKALSFNDTHDARLLTGFDVGYFVSETLELFGGFEYVTANGDTTQLGTVVNNTFTITDTTSTTTTIAINDTIDATFDDYNSWAIKLGVTKYFPII